MARLDSVEPNGWNPNVVPEHVQRSIEHGFRTDGWLASHALLVWRTDEKRRPQNKIIDGEHRWQAGRAVGLAEGPMVFLDGITEAQAKALTVKLDQKRGKFDADRLGALLRSIQVDDAQVDDVALDLGFEEDELLGLLADAPMTGEAQGGRAAVGAGASADEFAQFENAQDDGRVPFRIGQFVGRVDGKLHDRFAEVHRAMKAEKGGAGVMLEDVVRRWVGG